MHRSLDDDAAPVPFEFWLGRICEEFHCLPSEALKELHRAPVGLLETIIEMRGYAQAKAMSDAAETLEQRKRLPAICGLVLEISAEIALEP